MKYYIISGERSGDLHGGNLLKELRKRDDKFEARAVGGDYLNKAGAELSFHYTDIAVMGFAEVVFSFRKVLKAFKKVKQDINRYKPDVVILVDFGGFNLRMAKFAKENGVKVFYYITPKVWAWNQNRAYKIKKWVDQMFVILPFEKEFYRKFNWEVDYTGNPVVDAVSAHQVDIKFLENYSLSRNKKIVALLPGSRKQELQKVVPLYKALSQRFPEVQFVVAGVKSLSEELYNRVIQVPNITVVYEETYNLLNHADAAVVTSGTATLETSLFDVPQVVVYKTHPASYFIAKSLIKVEYISLVNLIADEEVVKELIQDKMNPVDVGQELDKLLNDASEIERVKKGYLKVKNILGAENASSVAAEKMIAYLNS